MEASRTSPDGPGRRRLALRRSAPVAVLAAVAFAVGVVTGGAGEPAERTLARGYVAAWERGDYEAMHAQLTPAARRAAPLEVFAQAHETAAATATAVATRAGEAGDPRDGVVAVPMTVRTRIFGTLRETLRLPVQGEGEQARVAWARHLSFPGVAPGAALRSETTLPERADILARDGSALARGSERSSALGPEVAGIAGTVGPAPPERRPALTRRGVPTGAAVGLTGLERVFDEQLAGRPGGVLRAGERILARTRARPGETVHSSIDPDVQSAASAALAGRVGGIAVLRPGSGEILALSGIAFSGLQPPGSTFKIITLAGALEAQITGPQRSYPVRNAATLEGVEVQNANNQACGGTLAETFAKSCNSVFAPLGAELGAQRLVRAAERFGFNAPVGIAGAATSTIPAADDIGDDLAVGATAIGQGRVQATALQMAWVAATIATGGRRPQLSLERGGGGGTGKRVLDPEVAETIGRYMVKTVRDGTGMGAALEGVRVAGKTGTAELRATQGCVPVEGDPASCPPGSPEDTSAWFNAYAPENDPQVAIGVLLVGAGTGGGAAAPAAQQVLRAALG